MKIYITGGSGLIGSAFIHQAKAAGHEVLSMEKPDCLESFSIDAIKSFAPDVVMHCAWLTNPSTYRDSPYNIVLRNASLQFFNQLRDNGIKHFVCCGTCAEYGKSNNLLSEDESKINPQSLYAQTKHELHVELIQSAKESDIKITWARIFYPYGPQERSDRLISSIIKAIQTGKEMQLQAPNAIRDFIHVEDVASALLFLCQKKSSGVFNIGTGCGITLRNIQNNIQSLMQGSAHNKRFDSPSKEIETLYSNSIVASVKKIKSLGWEHHFTIDAGLKTYTQLQEILNSKGELQCKN